MAIVQQQAAQDDANPGQHRERHITGLLQPAVPRQGVLVSYKNTDALDPRVQGIARLAAAAMGTLCRHEGSEGRGFSPGSWRSGLWRCGGTWC